MHLSKEIPVKPPWGSWWHKEVGQGWAGQWCPAGPTQGLPAGSGASPTGAGILPWAGLHVPPADLGTLHGALGKCRDSLRQFSVR